VKKFIQFQLTINIVICLITVLGGATIGQVPLNVIQMLWTNLIMDILGAIALCTQPPSKDYKNLSATTRISRRDKVMNPSIWR